MQENWADTAQTYVEEVEKYIRQKYFLDNLWQKK